MEKTRFSWKRICIAVFCIAVIATAAVLCVSAGRHDYLKGTQTEVISSGDEVMATGVSVRSTADEEYTYRFGEDYPKEALLRYLSECELVYIGTVKNAQPFPQYEPALIWISLQLRDVPGFVSLYAGETDAYVTVFHNGKTVLYELAAGESVYDELIAILGV